MTEDARTQRIEELSQELFYSNRWPDIEWIILELRAALRREERLVQALQHIVEGCELGDTDQIALRTLRLAGMHEVAREALALNQKESP